MADDRPPNDDMLMSWKEIAAFFRRDVRTLQRWEREQGLPVLRHQHHQKSSVYAYRGDLEAWWRQHQTVGEDGGQGPTDATIEEGVPRRRQIRWATIVSTGALAMAVMTLVIWTSRSKPGSRPVPGFPFQRFADHDGRFGVLSLSDINDDGLADLVLGGNGIGEVRIYFGRSSDKGPRAPDLQITTALNADFTGGIVGDVDGDGLSDLVVSALLKEPDGLYATGPSYLLRGRRQWPAVLELPRDADVTFAIDLPHDIRMVSCFGRVIDLNADGLSDVVLGGADFSPPGRRSAGGVFVLFGRRTWPSRIDMNTGFDVAIHGSRTGEGLGVGCGTGDFNGDRKPELAIMASETTLWGLLGGRGRVYVVGGRDRWPRVIDVTDQTVLAIEGTTPRSELTWPVLADVNGDGVDDLAVGVASGRPNSPRGRVAIFLGGRERRARLSMDEADVILDGVDRVNEFGDAVALHDVNRDGYADLFVGDPRTGSIRMFLGRARWPRRTTLAAYRPIDLVIGEVGAGASSVVFGDYDGDGATELAFAVNPRRAGSDRPHWTGMMKPYLPITIDIRPASSPNLLLRSGVFAVGVSATDAPAFSDLDHRTLTLAGQAPTHMAWRDFDNDGAADLQLYFDGATVAVRDDAKRLALVGRTRQGLPVAGADDVTVVAAKGVVPTVARLP